VSKPDQLTLYTQQAQALLDHGRAAEAEQRLAQALRVDPRSGLALGMMSLVKLQLREDAAALQLAREAVAADPGHEWGHRVLSIVLRFVGKHEQALAPAREAARLAPESPEVLRNLAVGLIQVHALTEAREIADRVALLAPDSARGPELRALVAAAEGRKEEAERSWREALRLDPENPTFHNNLALVLLARGAEGEAVERFLGAVQGDPRSDAYHANLGVGLERFRNAFGYYFLASFLGFLLFVSVVGLYKAAAAGKWRGEGSDDVGSACFSIVLWGGLTFAYMRWFLRWRRERLKVLPLLKTWRPRLPWRVRFFAGWRHFLRSPPFVVYVGLLLLLFGASVETASPLGSLLLLVPGAMVLWGLWRWLFWRRKKPPIDTEL
jgi:Tfp pilus assembly protein PilF